MRNGCCGPPLVIWRTYCWQGPKMTLGSRLYLRHNLPQRSSAKAWYDGVFPCSSNLPTFSSADKVSRVRWEWNLFSRSKDLTVFLLCAVLSLDTSRKRRPLFLNVIFVEMISELLGGFQQFLYHKILLRFQSRDKWYLNNYDAIEIKSKGFYVSNVTVQYVQNSTSKLKRRRANSSWLMWVVF